MQGFSGTVAVVLTVPLLSFMAPQLLTNKSIKSAYQKDNNFNKKRFKLIYT